MCIDRKNPNEVTNVGVSHPEPLKLYLCSLRMTNYGKSLPLLGLDINLKLAKFVLKLFFSACFALGWIHTLVMQGLVVVKMV